MTTRTRDAIAQDAAARQPDAARAEGVLRCLAAYLTGPALVHATAGMVTSRSGAMRAAAEQFFALREAFGVLGHTDAEGALEEIRRTLGRPPQTE